MPRYIDLHDAGAYRSDDLVLVGELGLLNLIRDNSNIFQSIDDEWPVMCSFYCQQYMALSSSPH